MTYQKQVTYQKQIKTTTELKLKQTERKINLKLTLISNIKKQTQNYNKLK